MKTNFRTRIRTSVRIKKYVIYICYNFHMYYIRINLYYVIKLLMFMQV